MLPHGNFADTTWSAGPTPGGGVSSLLPTNWTVHCPNPALCPKFERGEKDGVAVLTATGNGRIHTYGWVEAPTSMPLQVGKTYCLSADLGFSGIDDLCAPHAPNF